MFKDKFGNTITEEESDKLMCDKDYSRINYTKINDYWVSTVFTGCAYFTPSRIYYFDTAVFKKNKLILNERTRTLKDAEETHNYYVRKVEDEQKRNDT